MADLGTPPQAKLADVKWRVDSKPTNGRARFLPYLDAYLAARLLDDWVGPGNWSDAYEQAPGKGLWCHLSIKVDGEWVTKTDIGVPSNMEAEKGQVSDAFKRACSLKWGVGGNVYRLPNVWAPVDERANRTGEAVAYPNDKTIPAIIVELKKQGFTDADAGEATADHDDESNLTPSNGSVTPNITSPAADAPLEELSRRDLVVLLADAGLPTNGTEQVLRDRWAAHQIEGGAPDREEGDGKEGGALHDAGPVGETPPSSDLADRAAAMATRTSPLNGDGKSESAKAGA